MGRFAVIEMGSHTFRSIVCKRGLPLEVLQRQRIYVGSARYVDGGVLTEEGSKKAILGVHNLLKGISSVGATRCLLIATGVYRSIKNQRDFFLQVEAETGLMGRVLDGKEEAELSFLGASFSLGIRRNIAVFDIGGGSTELGIDVEGRRIFFSLPVGCLLLMKEFPSCERDRSVWDDMCSWIRAVIKGALDLRINEKITIAGTGGTAVSLAAMSKGIGLSLVTPKEITGTSLSQKRLLEMKEQLLGMSLEERAQVPGLDRERAGPIMPGIGIVLEILSYFNKGFVVVSFEDLLEGIALRLLGEE